MSLLAIFWVLSGIWNFILNIGKVIKFIAKAVTFTGKVFHVLVAVAVFMSHLLSGPLGFAVNKLHKEISQ